MEQICTKVCFGVGCALSAIVLAAQNHIVIACMVLSALSVFIVINAPTDTQLQMPAQAAQTPQAPPREATPPRESTPPREAALLREHAALIPSEPTFFTNHGQGTMYFKAITSTTNGAIHRPYRTMTMQYQVYTAGPFVQVRLGLVENTSLIEPELPERGQFTMASTDYAFRDYIGDRSQAYCGHLPITRNVTHGMRFYTAYWRISHNGGFTIAFEAVGSSYLAIGDCTICWVT